MPSRSTRESPPAAPRDEHGPWQRARELQKRLYEGGFAGICFPREYGGLGLPYEYQKAFDEESLGYEMPIILNMPTFTICCATMLDTGSEEQKTAAHRGGAARRRGAGAAAVGAQRRIGSGRRHHPRRPAGRQMGDQRREDMEHQRVRRRLRPVLARTNWDVPKHEGLTMFLVPIAHPGITMRRITQVDGGTEFCEEFFDGLELGDDAVVGEVNDGWAVASRQLYHERRAVGQGSEFASGIGSRGRPHDAGRLRRAGGEDGAGRQRARARDGRPRAGAPRRRRAADRPRLSAASWTASLPPAAGTIIRIFHAETVKFEMDTALAIAGAGRRRRGRRQGLADRAAIPVAAGASHRRRHHRDRAQHHRRTGTWLPARIRRRPRRAVQSGAARPGGLTLLFGEDVFGFTTGTAGLAGFAGDEWDLDQR